MLIIEVDGSSIHGRRVAAIAHAAHNDGLIDWVAAKTKTEADAYGHAQRLSPSLRKLAPNKLNEDVSCRFRTFQI